MSSTPQPSEGNRIRSGAGYYPKKDRWKARIVFDGTEYNSPYFVTKQEAEDWYAEKSFELYGFDRVHELDATDVVDSPDNRTNTTPQSEQVKPFGASPQNGLQQGSGSNGDIDSILTKFKHQIQGKENGYGYENTREAIQQLIYRERQAGKLEAYQVLDDFADSFKYDPSATKGYVDGAIKTLKTFTELERLEKEQS